MQFSRFLKALTIGVTFASAPQIVIAERQLNSGSDRFTTVNEGPDRFEDAFVYQGCDVISDSLKFCTKGTDWVLAEPPDWAERALYQNEAGHRASFTVRHMDKGAASDLAQEELEALYTDYIATGTPYGPYTVKSIVEERRSKIQQKITFRSAFVTDADGYLYVSQLNVFILQYGIGFLETIQQIEDVGISDTLLDTQEAFHASFLDQTRVVVNVGTGRN